MSIVSVNVSLPTVVEYKGRSVETGIFKRPVSGRLMMRELNLDGDGQADLTVHGGRDKAVYLYSNDDYQFWKRELGREDLPYGLFGENLTVEGLRDDVVRIGDVFRVGDASIQVTQPRLPCFKLAIKMEDPAFPKRFLAARRMGFYVRVLAEGEVGVGDEVELVERDPEPLTIAEVVDLWRSPASDLDRVRAALRVRALSASWREDFEGRLRGERST